MSRNIRRGPPEVLEHDGVVIDRYRPVVEGPDRPPIVIVHGTMDRAAGFRRTIGHLPDREVLAYDRRGYARSGERPVASRLTDHLEDLAVVLSLVEEPALLVGHSLGGVIALWALATPPLEHDVLGAVIWEAPMAWEPWYEPKGSDLMSLPESEAAESFMRRMIGDPLWERLPESMRNQRRAEGAALQADLRHSAAAESVVRFDRISAPVLIGYGSRSSNNHRRSAITMAESLNDARVVEIDGADHGIHLSKPATFAAFIESW